LTLFQFFQPAQRGARPPPREASPSKASDALYLNATPLKSTGLFREFTKSSAPTQVGSGARVGQEKRKTSFTTEKTILIQASQEQDKPRRMSVDCNFVFETSPTTYTTFSPPDHFASSLSSNSFSSTSSKDSVEAPDPIRIGRQRSTARLDESTPHFTPDPPVRERKTSRRIFIQTPYHNFNHANTVNKNNDSCGDETSSNVSSTDEGSLNENDTFGDTYMSASSRLLYNLSSGYRQHRAAAAANSAFNVGFLRTSTSTVHTVNYNVNEDAYPRRRFSQEHLILQEEEGDTMGKSLNLKRPARQPVRKISLPIRPTKESAGIRPDMTRSDKQFDFIFLLVKVFHISLHIANPFSRAGPASLWSRFRVCDDSLFYPGCCVQHNRRSLEEKQVQNMAGSSKSLSIFSLGEGNSSTVLNSKLCLSFKNDHIVHDESWRSASGMAFCRKLVQQVGLGNQIEVLSDSGSEPFNNDTLDTEESELENLTWEDGSDIFQFDEDDEQLDNDDPKPVKGMALSGSTETQGFRPFHTVRQSPLKRFAYITKKAAEFFLPIL